MSSRINPNKPAPTAKPSTPKPAPRPSGATSLERPTGGWSAAAVAGWGTAKPSKVQEKPAPGGAASLTLTHASIEEGREPPKGFPAPAGFKLSVQEHSETETIKLKGGETATFIIESASLLVKNEQTGKTVELAGPKGETIADMKQWFHESFDAGGGDDDDGPHEWDSLHGFSGYGTAGQLVSVRESLSSFTGGAHPDAGSVIGTYDLRTGKPVKLSELLTPKQFDSIVRTIEKQLPHLKTTDPEADVDGTVFNQDPAVLRETIDANFALVTGKNGEVHIDVAWESGVHALANLEANFTFDAPADAAFKEKIGAE